MPLTNSTTAVNGSEREQIFPLLDSVKLKTLRPGRPRKRFKVLAADKGSDSKEKRLALRKRGIRPQLPKRNYKTKKNLGRPIEISVPRFRTVSDVSLGIKENIAQKVVRWERQKLTLMPSCF